MFKLATISTLLGLMACVAPTELDTDDDAVSTTSQDSIVYDKCAVGLNANAGLSSINVGDSFTRSFDTINDAAAGDCNCLQWQKDDNDGIHTIKTCRPTTIGDVQLGSGGGYDLYARVTSWHAMANGQTECENSTFNVKVQEWNQTTLQYETMPGGASGDIHPQFTNGACQPVLFLKHVIVGPENSYRVRALATRGLGTNGAEHGFEGVTIQAIPNDVIGG